MAIIIKKKAAVNTPEPAPIKKPETKNLDSMCQMVIGSGPNAVVSWWLMASYTYYIHDVSLLSDGLYDEMAKDMLARWDSIEHPHKHLIKEADLKAGSLFGMLAENYPAQVKGAASQVARIELGITIPIS